MKFNDFTGFKSQLGVLCDVDMNVLNFAAVIIFVVLGSCFDAVLGALCFTDYEKDGSFIEIEEFKVAGITRRTVLTIPIQIVKTFSAESRHFKSGQHLKSLGCFFLFHDFAVR